MVSEAAVMKEKLNDYVTGKTDSSDVLLREAVRLGHAFRGPLLLSLVIGPFLVRYFVQILSSGAIVTITVLLLGTALTCHDLCRGAEQELRRLLQRGLNGVVLDDVLRSIFDPQVGLVTVMTSTVIGNASMYALPMSNKQRVELMQSCLLTSPEETSEILLAPGGVRQLLPTPVQQWLEEDPKQKQLRVDRNEGSGEHREEATTDSDTDSETEPALAQKARSMPSLSREKPSVIHTSSSTNDAPQELPADPLMVMGKIVKELSIDGMQSMVKSIPDAWLQGASIAGTLALCLHLRSSPRARHVVGGVLEGTTAMGFAAVAVGGFSALLAKQGIERPVAPPRGQAPQEVLPSGWKQFVLRHIKTIASRCKNSRQLQAAVAFIALYYFGRVRQQQLAGARRFAR